MRSPRETIEMTKKRRSREGSIAVIDIWKCRREEEEQWAKNVEKSNQGRKRKVRKVGVMGVHKKRLF